MADQPSIGDYVNKNSIASHIPAPLPNLPQIIVNTMGGDKSVPNSDTSGQENNAATKPSTAPTTPTNSSQPAFELSGMNPLALNLMYNQAIAPMMQNLSQQLMGANAGFAQQASDNPMAKYMPPQFQAFFKNQNANMAQQQNDITGSLISAAMNAPAVDALMSQVTTGRQEALSDYEKYLYNQAQGLNTANQFNTSGNNTNSAQQIVNNLINQVQSNNQPPQQQTGP